MVIKGTQEEHTEEVLKGIVTDIVAHNNEKLEKMFGDKINEVKKTAEDTLAEMKKVPEKKEIHTQDIGEETEADPSGMPTPYKSFGAQLQDIYKAAGDQGIVSNELKQIHDYSVSKAVLGQAEGTPDLGGFLVQTEFRSDIMRRIDESESLKGRATTVPIGANFNGTSIPAINETSRKDGSRQGGIQVYRADEAASVAATNTKVRTIDMKLEKLMGTVYTTEEMLADASQLNALLPDMFAREFNFKVNDEMYNGSGSGRMQGILNTDALVTVDKESAQPEETILFENIVNMWSRSYAPGRPNSVWNINQDIEPQLFTMSLAVGTGGVPVYLPAGGLSASPYGQLMGRPVIPIEQAATLGTVGDITFNDWRQYLVIEKGGIQASSSIHVQFLTDQSVFKFTMRNNGQSWWNSKLTPYKGTNTQSPFIALQTRS